MVPQGTLSAVKWSRRGRCQRLSGPQGASHSTKHPPGDDSRCRTIRDATKISLRSAQHLVVSDFVTSGFDCTSFFSEKMILTPQTLGRSRLNDNDNNNNNNNNNEILIKRKPLVSTRARLAVQKKRERTKRERLGQYNSNNKLIHGQYTSR